MGFLKSVRSNFDDVRKTIEVDYPGVINPPTGAYGETLGRAFPTPKGYEDIRAQLALLQDIVYPKSGKQINITELTNLYRYIPKMTDKPETVTKKLAAFEQALSALEKGKLEAYRESGYGVGNTPQPSSDGVIRYDATGKRK